MIKAVSLSKRFGYKRAVDDISFEVEKGEVLGFLGPNGAGKSTTMRMVTGYLAPTAGSVGVGGVDAIANPIEAQSKIGYLPESAPLYSEMSVSGFLRFMAELRGFSGAEGRAAVDGALETCFLEPVRNQSIDTLSKGYRHRTCLAQADPARSRRSSILDEPTDGLDPNQKQEVRNLIRRLGKDKVILFSTHILEEVDAVCSRAIIIDQGKIVADGSPAELRGRAKGAGAVRVRINGMAGSGIRSELASLGGVADVEELKSGELSFEGRALPSKPSASISEAIFNLCKDRGWSLEELHVEEGRLDEVFREITVADTKLAKAG